MGFSPIERCNHCNSSEGYYTKDYVVGKTRYRHNFDGSKAENGDYYEHLKHKQSKYAYCLSCNKRLFEIQ